MPYHWQRPLREGALQVVSFTVCTSEELSCGIGVMAAPDPAKTNVAPTTIAAAKSTFMGVPQHWMLIERNVGPKVPWSASDAT